MEKFLFSTVIILSLFLGSVSLISMGSSGTSLVDEIGWFFSEPKLAEKMDRTRVKELVLKLEKAVRGTQDRASQKLIVKAIIKGRELLRALHHFDVIARNYDHDNPLFKKTADYVATTKHEFLHYLRLILGKDTYHAVAIGN